MKGKECGRECRTLLSNRAIKDLNVWRGIQERWRLMQEEGESCDIGINTDGAD